MSDAEISNFNKSIEKILKDYPLVQITIPKFRIIEDILNEINIPKIGAFILMKDTEIRYYPSFEESFNEIDNQRELYEKPGIITDKLGLIQIDNTYLSSIELVQFDSNLVKPNQDGFIYLRDPEFYVTKDKFIYIKNFTGSKQKENESYYSPYLEYNDKMLDSIEEGERILYK